MGALTYLGAYYGWTLLGVLGAFAVLLAFFFTSIALSRVGIARKQRLIDLSKGGPRDAWQVAANGGVATLCAVIAALLSRGSGAPPHVAYAMFWAYAGAYAAATADTWATEIGSAFGGTPLSLAGFQRVAPGLSGGVTLVGTVAMIAGAAWIAFVWSALAGGGFAFAVVTVAGCAGALVDSLLGATLQSMFRCPKCERTTELELHVCGTQTIAERGLPWLTNDAVNAIATLTGAVVAGGLFLALT